MPTGKVAPDVVQQLSEATRIACYPHTGTDSFNPKEAFIMFWSVLGAVLLLALAAAIYHHQRRGTHVRNSRRGQPMKNIEGAAPPEAAARNPNIMGGGGYFR